MTWTAVKSTAFACAFMVTIDVVASGQVIHTVTISPKQFDRQQLQIAKTESNAVAVPVSITVGSSVVQSTDALEHSESMSARGRYGVRTKFLMIVGVANFAIALFVALLSKVITIPGMKAVDAVIFLIGALAFASAFRMARMQKNDQGIA